MKKKVSFLLVIMLLLSLPSLTHARSSNLEDLYSLADVYTDGQGNYFANPELTQMIEGFYSVSNGVHTPISVDEYVNYFKKPNFSYNEFYQTDVEVKPYSEVTPYPCYDETASISFTAPAQRASIDYINDTLDPIQKTIQYELTKSSSFSIGLTWLEKNAIKAEIGATWANSATIKDSTSWSIQPGYKSWVEWSSYMRTSLGYLYNFNIIDGITRERASAEYPVKTSLGELDGAMRIVTEPLD